MRPQHRNLLIAQLFIEHKHKRQTYDFVWDCKAEAGVFLQSTKLSNLFTFPAFKFLSIRFYDTIMPSTMRSHLS